jgi:hypothetical protein
LIAGQIEAILRSDIKNLTKNGLIRALCSACGEGNGSLHEVVRRHPGSLFAQVFEKEFAEARDARTAFRDSIEHEVGRTIDQLALEAVPSPHLPDLLTYARFKKEVLIALAEPIAALSKKVVDHPDKVPRRPPVPRGQRAIEQRKLRHLSLLPIGQGAPR